MMLYKYPSQIPQHLPYFLNFMFYVRTAVAIRGKDGVVFAVEKLVQSKLYEKGANKRIFNIDRHVGMVSITRSTSIGTISL